VGGTLYNALITTTGSAAVASGMSGGVNAVAGSVVNVMTVESLYPGTAANDYQVVFAASATIGAPSGNFDMTVMAPVDSSGTMGVVEIFRNASLDPTDARFIASQVLNGIPNEVNPSQYVLVDVLADDGTVTPGTYTLGTAGGVVGTDGISGLVYTDYIGTVSGQSATGLQAVRNPEKVSFNVLLIPGVSDQRVIAAALAVVQARNDSMYIVDPPFGASVQQVVDWHNGVSDVFANSPTEPLDSRYMALYWSWVKTSDVYNNVELWLPPSGAIAASWARSDAISSPSISPAGPINGLVDGDAVEYSPDATDRILLEGYQNCVNAIIDNAAGGLMSYGDKTMQRAPSSLTYLSVQRNLLYAQALCVLAMRTMLFKPNDPQTWLKLKALVNPILQNIATQQGFSSFLVVCDSTTNPQQQINLGVLKILIKIAPILSAREIVADFAIYQSGATLTQ
jgi:phage tail sheath protein FI